MLAFQTRLPSAVLSYILLEIRIRLCGIAGRAAGFTQRGEIELRKHTENRRQLRIHTHLFPPVSDVNDNEV